MIVRQLILLISCGTLCLTVVLGQTNAKCSFQQNCVKLSSCQKYNEYFDQDGENKTMRPLSEWPSTIKSQLSKSFCKREKSGSSWVYYVCCDQADSSSGMKLLDMENCGKFTADKIAFGKKAQVFEYPWMALLFDSDNAILCGGTLIAASYVLTAAHCNRPPVASVRLGENDLDNDIDCFNPPGEDPICSDPPQNIQVAEFIAHEKYSPGKKKNDIALIKLATPAKLSESVKTICLPIGEMLLDPLPRSMIVTGWGYTEASNTISSVLRYANVPTVSLTQCAAELSQLSSAYTLDETQLCAGGRNKVDNCAGDSGGPLQYPSGQSSFVQYGIVSYGMSSCGVESSPGVYTNVVPYVDWILSKLQ